MPEPWRDVHLPVATRVEALLDAMTVDEWAGQLGSYWPRPETPTTDDGQVAPMEHAMQERPSFEDANVHGLGHLTRAFGSAPVPVSAGIRKLADYQRAVVERSRFGIPAIAHEECLTGFTAYGACVYPTALAWGATFDPGLIERMAARIGRDMRALGIHQGLAPLMDVVRDYRWGRVEETIGEDPYLVGSIGTAYVKGLQSQGVIATLKHYAGYSASRGGRNHAPVGMGRREFEDVMLPSFEMAVRDGHAGSVMNSYSDIDGEPAAASHWLLTEVLRGRWGFTGTLVSDYWAVSFLALAHHVVQTRDEAGALALRAGVDVELPETSCYCHLADQVAAGLLDAKVVREAARRVLTQKAELGLLDPGWDPLPIREDSDLDSPANRALAREVAEQSIVLLDNKAGLLPLAGCRRLAVIGPIADNPTSFLGCYSFPNHVLAQHPGVGLGVEIPSLLAALREEFPTTQISYAQGVPIQEPDDAGISEAIALGRGADAVLLTVGDQAGMFGNGTSGEGCDVGDLRLPGYQADLVETVLATGAPVILVVVSGRPYALGDYADRCAAVIQAFFPGEEGAEAIAGVLSGRINPSGRLPVGIPRASGGQPGTYLTPELGWYSEGVSNLDPRPLYPFGYGLSFTTFEISQPELSDKEIRVDGRVDVSVRVTNTGHLAGAHVVQLYLSDPVAQVVRPLKQLAGFTKVWLDAGQTRTVTFHLSADMMSFTGRDYTRIVEPGEIRICVGGHSEDLSGSVELTLSGGVRVLGEGRTLTVPVTLQ